MITWNHVIVYELLVFDWNTWTYITVCKNAYTITEKDKYKHIMNIIS